MYISDFTYQMETAWGDLTYEDTLKQKPGIDEAANRALPSENQKRNLFRFRNIIHVVPSLFLRYSL